LELERRHGLGAGAVDVFVVGGGVAGLSVAWKAAASGLSVALADPDPRRGASWAAAGMLAPVTELEHGEEALLRLNLFSASLYPDFVAELEELTGTSVGYRRCGTLTVAADASDRSVLLELHRFQSSLGLESTLLSSRECRELEPCLAPGVRSGLLAPGDHQVDNRELTAALGTAAARSGVEVLRAGVAAVELSGNRVIAARLEDGSLRPCGQLVLAAGCWSGSVAGLPPGAVPPVRPVKGQILRLRGPQEDAPLARTVRGVVRGSRVYLVPRADGRLVVGATAEEMGYDTRVTAGAVRSLLDDATELVPAVSELELVEQAAALRPGSPDNAPLLGRTRVDGLLLATGHYRNGFLLAPVTAEVLARAVRGDACPPVAEAFSPLRFSREADSDPVLGVSGAGAGAGTARL
jgi:glycine oxidase